MLHSKSQAPETDGSEEEFFSIFQTHDPMGLGHF